MVHAFGRVSKTTFPSTHIETYGYDNVGNLTSKIDRKNQQLTYTYDQLNRLTQKSYPDTTAVNYTYDDDSRLTQVTDPTGTYTFTFDNMGRLTNTATRRVAQRIGEKSKIEALKEEWGAAPFGFKGAGVDFFWSLGGCRVLGV